MEGEGGQRGTETEKERTESCKVSFDLCSGARVRAPTPHVFTYTHKIDKML